MDSSAQNFPAKTVAEGDLPERLGVSRPVLRLLRDELLREGEDWELREKQIWLTAAAAEKIGAGYRRLRDGSVAQLKNVAPAPPPLEKNGGAQGPGVVLHELRVWKADGFAGGRILLARTPGGRSVKVRVRSSSMFVAGMVLYARRVDGEVYEFAGPYPRWRGERLYRPAAGSSDGVFFVGMP